jgi:hypothetical protein
MVSDLDGPTTTDQVEDKDDHGENEQQVDKTAGDVEAEAQQPKDQDDYKNCPEHVFPFFVRRTSVSSSHGALQLQARSILS